MSLSVKSKPIGRPPREFDEKIVKGLCEVLCTVDEIEHILRCDQRSLDYWCKRNFEGESFATVYKRFSEGGKASLRRNQFNLSKTNSSMAIWLGKQWLGQKDISREEVKDIGQDIINAIRESESKHRDDEAVRSSLETQQPLLDQGRSGEENKVFNELGAERAI